MSQTSLDRCPDCHHQLDPEDHFCPNCGRPRRIPTQPLINNDPTLAVPPVSDPTIQASNIDAATPPIPFSSDPTIRADNSNDATLATPLVTPEPTIRASNIYETPVSPANKQGRVPTVPLSQVTDSNIAIASSENTEERVPTAPLVEDSEPESKLPENNYQPTIRSTPAEPVSFPYTAAPEAVIPEYFPSSRTKDGQEEGRKPLPKAVVILLIALIILVIGSAAFYFIAARITTKGLYLTELHFKTLTVVYASDKISITEAQQAKNFSDDPVTKQHGHQPYFVRLSLHEEQVALRSDSHILYTQAFTLRLPGNQIVKPLAVATENALSRGSKRNNWLDFPVSGQLNLTELSLQIGLPNEAQMSLPLTDSPTALKYAPKQITPNTNFKYDELDWTINAATQTLFMEGKQASQQHVYIAVKLHVKNGTTTIKTLNNFIQLTADSTQVAPDNANSTASVFTLLLPGIQTDGIITFEAPATKNNQYTLHFLADPNGHYNEQVETLTFPDVATNPIPG